MGDQFRQDVLIRQMQGAIAKLHTSLPGGPFDGQEIAYQAATGVVWKLKYNQTTGYWDFIGGAALFAEVTTATTQAGTSYGNPASGSGPDITLPLAGDYDVAIGALMYQTTGGVGYMSYAIGGTGAVDADSISEGSTATGLYLSRTRRKTGLAASTVLASKYKTTANTLNIGDRWMRVIPVRVQ